MFELPIFYRQDNGPANAGVPAPIAPTLPSASPPSSPPAFDPQIYNPEGQSWKDLYNGTAGGLQSLKSQHTQALATVQAQVDAALGSMRERDTTIKQLQTAAQEQAANVTTLAEQAKTIPDLLQRAGYADRLEILMQFPPLVAAQVDQEVPGEDGVAPTIIKVNPYLELIATTTLAGEALRKHLSQLSGALPTAAPITSASPVIPPQPTPTGPPDVRRTLAELHEQMRLDPTNLTLRTKWMDALAGLPEGTQQQ
jgi:hypothetical protein